jgi:hypothetical protein
MTHQTNPYDQSDYFKSVHQNAQLKPDIVPRLVLFNNSMYDSPRTNEANQKIIKNFESTRIKSPKQLKV